MMPYKATELRNICRNHLQQAQKVHRTKTLFSIIVSVLCTFISFLIIAATNILQLCCFT